MESAPVQLTAVRWRGTLLEGEWVGSPCTDTSIEPGFPVAWVTKLSGCMRMWNMIVLYREAQSLPWFSRLVAAIATLRGGCKSANPKPKHFPLGKPEAGSLPGCRSTRHWGPSRWGYNVYGDSLAASAGLGPSEGGGSWGGSARPSLGSPKVHRAVWAHSAGSGPWGPGSLGQGAINFWETRSWVWAAAPRYGCLITAVIALLFSHGGASSVLRIMVLGGITKNTGYLNPGLRISGLKGKWRN